MRVIMIAVLAALVATASESQDYSNTAYAKINLSNVLPKLGEPFPLHQQRQAARAILELCREGENAIVPLTPDETKWLKSVTNADGSVNIDSKGMKIMESELYQRDLIRSYFGECAAAADLLAYDPMLQANAVVRWLGLIRAMNWDMGLQNRLEKAKRAGFLHHPHEFFPFLAAYNAWFVTTRATAALSDELTRNR